MAIGYQIHLPLRRSQQRQRRSAKLTSPGSSGFLPSPTSIARPRSHSKRAHPARQAHQPLGPGTASRPPKQHPQAPEANTRAESTSVIPTVPAPRCYPSKHPNTPTIQASVLTTAAFKAAAAQLVPRVEGRPVSRLRGVKGRPVSPSLAHDRRTPPSISPRIQHPWKSCTLPVLTLHVVGKAHFYQHVGSNVPGG